MVRMTWGNIYYTLYIIILAIEDLWMKRLFSDRRERGREAE
jgi:hypothetical protein